MSDENLHDVEAEQSRAQFALDAAKAEQNVLAGGKTYPLTEAFEHLEARLARARMKAGD